MKSTLLTAGALATVGALGALAGATLAGDTAPAPATGTPAAAPVEVRTQTIHRTERVVRHVRRRHPRHQTPPVAAAAPARIPVSAPAAPAAPPVATHPASAPSPRIVSRTSGAGTRGDGEDHERHDGSEGGGDD